MDELSISDILEMTDSEEEQLDLIFCNFAITGRGGQPIIPESNWEDLTEYLIQWKQAK